MSANTEDADLILTSDDEGRAVVRVGGREVADAADLPAAAPKPATPEAVGRYCEALNYLARGYDYRVILDPEEYRTRYEARWAAEDPDAPFQQGVPRLHDFGHADLAKVQAPRIDGASAVFFAEDDYLGIPYRVTAPAPGRPGGEVVYDPVETDPRL